MSAACDAAAALTVRGIGMCAHPYVRLYLQTGWTKDRGSRHSRRTADQLYRLGDEACWVTKELGSTIDSVCIWSCSVITVVGSLVTRPIFYRSTQSFAVWQPENNGAEVTIERGNVLQRMGECLPSSSANFAQGPKMITCCRGTLKQRRQKSVLMCMTNWCMLAGYRRHRKLYLHVEEAV